MEKEILTVDRCDLERKMLETLLQQEPLEHDPSIQELKILLAEDSRDDFFFISEALEKAAFKHRLEWVADGPKALQYLEENYPGNLPSMILLDINMPKLNGHEVLRRIKADPRFKNILVVVLTSSRFELDVERAYDEGASSYITKNTNFNKLVEVLNSLYKFWFEIAKTPRNLVL